MRVLILNGPNLNLLGVREKDIYGEESFPVFLEKLKARYPEDSLDFFQSNHEGELIDKLHEHGFVADGIILNAGGYTHTSVALADAVAAIPAPVVEVHVSNIYRRESFRHHSWLSPVCAGVIAGFGLDSYELALFALRGLIK